MDRTPGLHLLFALALSSLFACDRAPEPARGTKATEVTGKALEQIDAPPYTFLRLRTESGEKWVAVPVAKVDAARPVTVAGAVPLKDFEIAPGRRVEVVYLGTLVPSGGK